MTGFEFTENDSSVDLSAVDFEIAPDISIDLTGNTITLPSYLFTRIEKLSITSSVEGGTVKVVVPGGTTVENKSILLSGQLKFIKTGQGTFASAVAQTYTAGTDVIEGTLRPAKSPETDVYEYSGDTFAAFGTGDVNVFPDGLFDVYGNYGYEDICLKGGKMTNTLRAMTKTEKCGIFVKSVGGEKDESYLNLSLAEKFAVQYGKAGLATDLGGKTLVVNVYGDFTMNSAMTNGTLKVVEKNGWFIFNKAFDMSTTVFDNTCAINVKGNIELGSYIQRKDTMYILGSGSMTVKDKFVPIGKDYFYGCTLLPGATLDLSQRDTLFVSYCKNHENKEYSVKFPESGIINVEIGDRKVKSNEKIVQWKTRPADGVKFVLQRGGNNCVGGGLVVEDDGLYIKNGFSLIVR
jgi:hypothetical protein